MDYKVHKINGIYGGEAYLIISGDDAVLVDTGYAIGVEKTIENIKRYLDGRDLTHIILTHSHYDHVMGSPAINEEFPKAKIYAHPKVSKVFAKPNARKTMEALNLSAAGEREVTAKQGWADKLHVDIDVKDGDIIQIGKMRIRILETPGHTKDSISLFFENEDLVFVSESLGVTMGLPYVIPGFIVSYEDSVKSIRKVMDLNPQNIVPTHGTLISGKDKDSYFEIAQKEIHRIHEIVLTSSENGMTIDEIIEILKDRYYQGDYKKFQPYDALYANWIPMITKLIQ